MSGANCKVIKDAGVPVDLDPTRFGPPSADLDPPTKLSENIILNVLIKMDDTLRSSAHLSMFLIHNMRIVNAYGLAFRWMFLLTNGKWARI